MSENAKITTLIENGTIVYPKTVKEAVYGLEEELNKKEVTIGSTPDEDAVLWIEPDGDVTTPIYAPNIVQVGQTIIVSAVDENGRPTAWEAADMPQGGDVEYIGKYSTSEEVVGITANLENLYKEIWVREFHAPNTGDQSGWVGLNLNKIQIGNLNGGVKASVAGNVGSCSFAHVKLEKDSSGEYKIIEQLILNSINFSSALYNIKDCGGTVQNAVIGSFGNGISSVGVSGYQSGVLGVGSYIEIWGVRI